jgi:hypothetical protein
MAHPRLAVAVVMQKTLLDNRWQSEQWAAVDVLPDEDATGAEPRRIAAEGRHELWLHPGLGIELFRDEAEGYFLNISAEQAFAFVVWREDEAGGQPVPVSVTLSYNEAARMMDAQEHVDGVPLPAHLHDWLAGYVMQHYKPEPKKRSRAPSFQGARRDDKKLP